VHPTARRALCRDRHRHGERAAGPPDKQPGAIKLVMEQMEQLAPRYADRAA
jgi:hypothetical protein